MSENLYDSLSEVALARTHAQCMCLPDGVVLTYGELFQQINCVARLLDDRGIGVGDRVAVQCEKTPLALVVYLGCVQLGSIYVPLNPSYTESELSYFLENAQPSLLIRESVFEGDARDGLQQLTLREDGSGTLADELAKITNPLQESVSMQSDDIAAILYTSGTTGVSKGAMLTHGNLLSNAETLNGYWGFTSGDVLLHALPIYHVHGLFVAVHCVLLSGCSMIFQPKFNVDDLIDELPNATVLMGVPTFYTRLLANEEFTKPLISNMRLFISGSAPLTEQTFHAFFERTGKHILERYGMSETLMNTSNPLDGERKAGTVGFPLPGVDVRIADESGRELPSGQIGCIELKGPNVFKGYWRMPEKTAEEFRDDGFFKTGDMGVQDEEGRILIVGREKDLVISGGLNVYPAEVESAIENLAEVEDVAVIGAPHHDFGEAVVAVVVVASGSVVSTDIVRTKLREVLASYKLPKQVECVDELPRNAMGKIQKNLLRDRFKNVFVNQ